MRCVLGLLTVVAAILFASESIADTWPEGKELILANHRETGALMPAEFNPDPERYFLLEKAGLMRLFTVRANEQLVGYAVFSVTMNLKYTGTLWANEEVLYVAPEHRGRTAVRFIRWTDNELKAADVDFILRDVTPRSGHARTLERMGYTEATRKFLRRLS